MMAKSKLQKRAEKASKLFPDAARKPIVIEFAGVPKAGKTTTISQVQAFLKRCGFKTEIVIERASICPIKDKKHVNFNIWTACTTLAQLLEKTQTPPRPEDPQILILDRGIFDSLCWLRMMERLNRLRPEERKVVQTFLEVADWRDRITGVILMTVSPEDSMMREQGLLPVEGGKGSIMNPEVLQQMTDVCKSTANELKDLFRIFEVDTSNNEETSTAKKTAETVVGQVLDWIEDLLEENILSIPKIKVEKAFNSSSAIDANSASRLVDCFHSDGVFAPRSDVESDLKRVQALPVVIVKNANGEVLRLRRKESSSSNPLHEKIVIWAGGHVRREDSQEGRAIPACAVREIEEELRLRLDENALTLLGAVYVDEGVSIGKHVAIVYEWRAATNDVAVALSNSEFFERRGTSLSGKFVSMEQLVDDLNKGKMSEEWSDTIIRSFLSDDFENLNPKLI
ncbi:MAG: NUDIX domain-containing protein [Nitrospirota bacterium]|nr:NUDIX domain-containing protein [Nitrospirota bacterium]